MIKKKWIIIILIVVLLLILWFWMNYVWNKYACVDKEVMIECSTPCMEDCSDGICRMHCGAPCLPDYDIQHICSFDDFVFNLRN